MSDSPCRFCGGTGSIDDFGFYGVPCPDCNGTGKQPDPIVAYEWTHEERPCHCTPEHRPHCHRCGGSGIYKSARLRRIDATTTHQAATEDSATGADHQAAGARRRCALAQDG